MALVRNCHGNTIYYCDYSVHWTPDAVSEVKSYYQEFAFPLSIRQHEHRVFLSYPTGDIDEENRVETKRGCEEFSYISLGFYCFEVSLVDLSKSGSNDDFSIFPPWIAEEMEELEFASSGTLIIQGWLSPNP